MTTIDAYLKELSLSTTASLPRGTLFYADGHLYEVIETDNKQNFSRARVWRQGEDTDVALKPKSILAERLRVVDKGYALPRIDSREALLKDGRFTLYVFSIEQNALDAAYLDAALCGKKSGLYVRRYDRYPAFELTNGLFVGRRYYFSRTNEDIDTDLVRLKTQSSKDFTPHRQGPLYWRLLSSWEDTPYYDTTQTIAFRPVDLADLEETAEHRVSGLNTDLDASYKDDTLTHIQIPAEELQQAQHERQTREARRRRSQDDVDSKGHV